MRLLASCGAAFAAACGGPTPAVEIPPPPDPTTRLLNYGTDTSRFAISAHRDVQQDVSGALTQDRSVTRVTLTLTVTEVGGALAARIQVDSFAIRGGPAISPGELRQVRGARFQGRLSPDGRLHDWSGAEPGGPLLNQLRTQLREFLPRIPIGGVRMGDRWTDTTTSDTDLGGVTVSIRAENQHEATRWTAFGNEEALEIRTVSEYTVSGEGHQAGQDLVLEGSGIRCMVEYLSAGGKYVGALVADSAMIDIVLPQIGLTIPALQRRTDTVAVLR